MSDNGKRLRDAIYDRAIQVPPAGAIAWTTTRKVRLPTLNMAQLPSLTVTSIKEPMRPYGDGNTGPLKFMAEAQIGIVVVRAFDDPFVLDGRADRDLDHILDAVLQDNTFTNHNITMDPSLTADTFYFESITRLDTATQIIRDGEAYAHEMSALLVFEFPVLFEPAAPYRLEEIDISLGPPYQAALKQGGPPPVVAEFQVGTINYQVTGPTSGVHGAPAGPFVVTLEPGASFTGFQSIIVSDGGAGGVFVPSIGSSGVGSIVVTPPNNAVTFGFTYAPAAAGVINLILMDGQDWNDPPPIRFTAS